MIGHRSLLFEVHIYLNYHVKIAFCSLKQLKHNIQQIDKKQMLTTTPYFQRNVITFFQNHIPSIVQKVRKHQYIVFRLNSISQVANQSNTKYSHNSRKYIKESILSIEAHKQIKFNIQQAPTEDLFFQKGMT
ncbi:hypothetical protein pb186bvf_019212 [Paramecium bursaria]